MGDAYPSERDEARALVEKCADCAQLAADVKLIANSVARVPATPRTRDFMLTAEQADKLRGGRVSRWLRSLGTPGWAMLRPVAGVALSIGLVMAVVGAGIPGMQPATYLPVDDANPVTTTAATASDAPARPVGGGVTDQPPMEGKGSDLPVVRETISTTPRPHMASVASPDPAEPELQQLGPSTPANTARDLLVYGGLAIALLSFGLLALAVTLRRFFADPLLR